MHDRMQSFLYKAIGIRLGLPDVDVAQAPLRTLDGQVNDQPGRWTLAETVGDASVERSIDRNVLSECVRHDFLQVN